MPPPPPPPSNRAQDPAASTAPAPFLVRALHSFSPAALSSTSSSTSRGSGTTPAQSCLSFEQGQVLRCFHRDPSGWWDGQVVVLPAAAAGGSGGRGGSAQSPRGWFPSNFVEVLEEEELSRLGLGLGLGPGGYGNGDGDGGGDQGLSCEARSLLDRIEHTVAVLEAAVRASRKDLYQPSTAHVISSIRTVLASTQCLTRDSPLLKTHPALSSARKRILSALAQLVNVARKASAPAGEPLDEEEGPGAPGRELVGVARETFGLVRTFLERAQQVGVRVDLEHANDLAPPSAAAAAAAGSTPKLGASTGRPPSRSKSRSPSAAGAGARAGAPTSPSPNAAAHQEDPGAEVRLSTAEAVAAHLSTLHDALLSTLAGLIAHLHAIASGTGRNPSARTVNLTREAVERVREVVRVSERVAQAAGGGRPYGEEEEGSLARLAKEREGLYQATVALVAAARRATEPEAGGGGESEGEGEGEAGRKDLLEAATAVVRAGGECVSAIERVVQAQLLLVAPPSDHGGGAGAGAGGGGSNLASELVLPKIRTAEQLAADVSAGPRAGDGPAEGGGTADAAGGGMATAESADTIRALGDRGGSDSSTLLGLLGQHVASLGVLKERLDADVQSAPDLANRADRLTLYEGDGGSVTAPLSPQARSASPVPTTTLSTSPAETVVPAAAAAASDSLAPASVPRTSLSARSSQRRGSTAGAAAGDTSSSGAMVRQQSTESAHSHSSSHVTNLSLASTAALTDQTDETSPRTSLAAGAAVAAGSIYHHGKRVSSSPGSPRPSSRQEAAAAGLAPLAIPARLSSSSTSSSREAGVSSPSLPFNYALPTSSSASLPSAVATPAPTTALSPPASAAATTTATTHTSGAPTSTTSGGLWFLERDYEPREISFNADGHVSGGTLRCLVERLTLHDTTIDPGFSNTFLLTFRMFVSPLELARLLWTRFDLAPPAHPQTGAALSPEEHKKWTAQKLTPVRLRVYNLFKTWVETYWLHDSDREVVDELLEWCQGRLKEALPAPSKRLTDLVNKRVAAAAAGLDASGKRSSLPSEFGMRQGGATGSGVSSVLSPDRSTPTLGSGSQGSTSSNGGSSTGRGLLKSMQSMDRLRQGFNSTAASAAGGHTSPPPLPSADVYSPSAAQASNAPPPVITKSQIAALRPVQSGRTPLLTSITELDPLELARQLTIMESRVYCAIRPDELLSAATANGSDGGAGSRGSTNEGPRGQNVRKMSALSTRLSGWIAEAILNEHDQKRRTALVKFYVKLGEHLLELGNYNAVFAVFTALSSSTIARLQKTWDGLAPKYRTTLSQLRKATDHARNYAEYRQKIRQALPPCLPFVGLFLTDLIFVYEGNRAERASPADPNLSLINFDRYHKMARVVGELQRFQSPYALVEVPELQAFLEYELDKLKEAQDAQSLYRQSLMIEPRQNETASSSAASFVSSSSGHRAGRDLFNWRG